MANVRYASRSAVHGSNAYDLKTARRAHYSQAAPAYRPETAPPKGPDVERAPKTAPKAAPGVRRRQQNTCGISLFAVTGFALVAVMLVFVLLAHARYNEVTHEASALQARLTELTEEERRLKIAYEDAFDINVVEEYATKVLGMTKPAESQIGAMAATPAGDRGVVVAAVDKEDGGAQSMGAFLASLIAYFK